MIVFIGTRKGRLTENAYVWMVDAMGLSPRGTLCRKGTQVHDCTKDSFQSTGVQRLCYRHDGQGR